MTQRQSQNLAGMFFVLVPILINIPYCMLIANFQYPDILRQPPGDVLLKFHQAGTGLILTWWAFGVVGIPLVYSVSVLHSILKPEETPYLMAGTVCGLISIVAQLIGLLRWTFVVPVLADAYSNPGSSQATREAAVITFQAVHQYGGVILGEHIGQLFTIIWMLLVGSAMLKSPLFGPWFGWSGIFAGIIYLLAQPELFATVIPSVPVVSFAGLVGSLLWLIWLILIGVNMFRNNESHVSI